MSEAGRKGKDVRSDCWIKFESAGEGISIDLKSKVEALYGEQINTQIKSDLKIMGIKNARITIEDAGALPFIISARLETAVLRAGVPVASPALSAKPEQKTSSSVKDRIRRSRLYLPGNMPHLFINAALHEPDGIILDLEDSVAPSEKDAARTLVRNALLSVDFLNCERMVRINQLPLGLSDLEWIVPYGVQMILIPKCESADDVCRIADKVNDLHPAHPVWLMPVIESALGCFHALEIATASELVAAITIGVQDYVADLGVQPTPEGRESLWARSRVVNTAKAAGIAASDSVFADVSDMEGLRQSALEAKHLGYNGKGCIHPRQIRVVHDVFKPSREEIEQAITIVRTYHEAKEQGAGAVALGTKMIDAPIVKRAQQILDLAKRLGLPLENDERITKSKVEDEE